MAAATPTVTITAGPHDRRACPVSVVLRDPLTLPSSLAVVDEATGRRLPAQGGVASGGGTLVSWIEPELPAGSVRTYRVVEDATAGAGLRLVEVGPGVLEVRQDGALVTAYHFGDVVARPFLFPLLGPGERPVTRHVDLAQREGEDGIDHIHHRSVWMAHGDVNDADNWSEVPGHARTVHRAFLLREEGPVYARFAAAAQWVRGGGEPLLDEWRQVTVYQRLPDERLILDLELTLTAAYGPARFGDTKEGGLLSVRVAPSMTGERGGLIETAPGALTEAETWGRPAHWCDYSGPASENDPTIVGIALMDHPLNPRHPTHWHVRDYGLMTANPFGLSAFYEDPARDGSLALPAGAALSFRYRLLVHAGRAAEGAVRAAYLDFAYPPARNEA